MRRIELAKPGFGLRLATAALAMIALAGCSHFGGSSTPSHPVSTFDLQVGDCLNPPDKITTELSTVDVVPCTTPHTEETYALVKYTGTGAATGTVYPGDAPLDQFAQGICAQRYAGYVGVAYPDSSLFFTYLLPSARSWQANDRSIVCIITSTGKLLTKSVKGSKL